MLYGYLGYIDKHDVNLVLIYYESDVYLIQKQFPNTRSRIPVPSSPPRLELLMVDLETSVQNTPPPKIGTFYGGVRNFGPEYPPPQPKIGMSNLRFKNTAG